MKKFQLLFIMALAMMVVLVVACVNVISDDETTEEMFAGKDITFQVTGLGQAEFGADTRAEVNISNLCSRLSLALYQNGTRVQKIDQTAEDNDDFGTLSAHLPYGTYTLVCLAHSSDGNATTTNAEKISFPSNHVTDTFLKIMEMVVDENTEKELNLSLTRVVSKFEIYLTDKFPEEVALMEIKYTGGSSTINAITGYGPTNSRQHEEFEITDENISGGFGVYTFLHDEEGKLKFTITAYDADDNEVYSRVFENVPMKRNTITRYKGNFFGKGFNGSITADDTWEYTDVEFD